MEKATNWKKEHKNMFIWVVEIYKYTYMPFEAGDSKVVNNKWWAINVKLCVGTRASAEDSQRANDFEKRNFL